MAWERGYYYRVKRIDGSVVREYVGRGEVAELAARLDLIERHRREGERAQIREVKDQLSELEQCVLEADALADLVAEAGILAAGYRKHHRGAWRKQREQDNNRSGSEEGRSEAVLRQGPGG
jgi:hypothetical protein